MTSPMFFTRFRCRLRFWAFHCALNALPSFCIAFFYLEFWKVPQAVSAMVLGIGTFILLYSGLTSLYGPQADENHVLARSLRLGTRIRAWISGLSILLLSDEKLTMFTPDFWCGFLSFSLLNRAADLFHPGANTFNLFGGTQGKGFLSVYATTMLEGFILSFLLLLISFFAVIVLQSKERRKVLRSARFCGDSGR